MAFQIKMLLTADLDFSSAAQRRRSDRLSGVAVSIMRAPFLRRLIRPRRRVVSRGRIFRCKLVVELAIPAVSGSRDVLFVGSNQEQQIAPSFWSAPSCGQAEPVDLATAGFPNVHLVLEVHGLKR